MEKRSRGESYDVAILGGGPAGSATALALASLTRRSAALRVVLIEKTDYSALRVGETLPPPAQRLLIDLGVWDAFLRSSPLESYGTRAAWGSDEFHDHEFIFSPYGRGWHVDRRELDALLVDEAERAGVEVYRRAVAQAHDRRDDQWRLTLQQAAAPACDIFARFIVDATGRRSVFAIARGARHVVFDQLVGAFVLLRVDPESPSSDTYTWVEACPEGWWYTALLPNGHMAAFFMTDASHLRRVPWRSLEQWFALASSAPRTAERLGSGKATAQPSLYSASSQRLDTCAGEGWLAVGDAASTFDPLSSQGVMNALRSGIHASRAIWRCLAGDSRALAGYGTAVASSYNGYLDQRAAYYGVEQRWPASPFWRCRHEAITLDPMQRLQFIEADHTETYRMKIPARLPAAELQRLAELCAQPLAASEVVTRFRASRARNEPDRYVVLALQDLIAGGVLDAVHMENQHQEEPDAGRTRHLQIRSAATDRSGRSGVLEQ